MASKDVSVESEAIFVTKLLTDDVENVIIHLRLISTAAEDTAASVFLSSASPATRML